MSQLNVQNNLTSNCDSQILLQSDGDKLLLILPTESSLEILAENSEIWQDFTTALKAREKSWPIGAMVHLIANDRLLDVRQLQIISEILGTVNLQLKLVCTNRRQTAIAAASMGYSVTQETPNNSLNTPSQQSQLAEPLYLKTTIRSGIEIRHPQTVIIYGDINPGGKVIATGDILVWGTLRGFAHAGAKGNREAKIMALRMEATQLRIAELVARVPETKSNILEPEIAYITPEGIAIAKAINFGKNHSLSNLDWQSAKVPKETTKN